MSNPVHIRKVIVEYSMDSLIILKEALENYHKYLRDVQTFDNYTYLSKGAIKRRIKKIEKFIESLEVTSENQG